MPKLTIHEQQTSGWVQGWLDRTGAEWVKCIDHFPEYPGKKIIGRTYMPDHESNALVWQGAAGAEQWFYRWLPVYRANPHVYCWEAPNEPHPMSDPAFRRALDEFTVRLAFLMQAEGLKLVGMNWSVGWPDIGHAPEFAASITDIVYRGHYLGLHEYCAPAMWDGDGWYTLRYRRTMEELANAGIPWPIHTLITECGIDGGVINQPKKGWKTYASEDEYVAQLAWYEMQLRQDDYVEAATIFTAGPYGDWLDFDVTESLALKLEKALKELEPVPSSSPSPSPSPSEEPDMKIKYYLAGNKVSDDDFYRVFGNGYRPYIAVGDGSDDDFPDILKAQIHEMHQIDNMALRCQLRMLDGSVPKHIEQYEFVIWIHGNDYRADFVVAGDGKAYAEWVMGHDGWWYNPQDGSAGAAICFVGRKDGTLHSEQVRGVGWFSDATYGSHCHANMVFTIEPSGTPPPTVYYYLYVSEDPEDGGYVMAEPPPVNDQYPEGTIVTLTVFTHDGWKFSHWSGDAAGPNPSIDVMMDRDKAIEAHFIEEDGDIDIPAARAHIQNADDLAVLLREQLALAAKALGVES